jgi:hypothetical protein
VKAIESCLHSAPGRTTGAALLLSLVLAPGIALGTGLATCDAGPQEQWQPQDALQKQLVAKGWKVNRIKIDGGCYEVYAIDENGKRVEAYFHPETLAPVPTKER